MIRLYSKTHGRREDVARWSTNREDLASVAADARNPDRHFFHPWRQSILSTSFSGWSSRPFIRVRRRVRTNLKHPSHLVATDLHVEWRNHSSYRRNPA